MFFSVFLFFSCSAEIVFEVKKDGNVKISYNGDLSGDFLQFLINQNGKNTELDLGNIENTIFQNILKIITYTSFIIFGIITIKQKNSDENILSKNNSIMKKNISYILFIAFSIAIGELGDKTFLASIGLGIQYPCFKIMLICGAIFGMIVSDSIAIIFGKFLSKKVPDNIINLCSGLLFLIFGFIGFINFIL